MSVRIPGQAFANAKVRGSNPLSSTRAARSKAPPAGASVGERAGRNPRLSGETGTSWPMQPPRGSGIPLEVRQRIAGQGRTGAVSHHLRPEPCAPPAATSASGDARVLLADPLRGLTQPEASAARVASVCPGSLGTRRRRAECLLDRSGHVVPRRARRSVTDQPRPRHWDDGRASHPGCVTQPVTRPCSRPHIADRRVGAGPDGHCSRISFPPRRQPPAPALNQGSSAVRPRLGLLRASRGA
jgi:hypothetical protein